VQITLSGKKATSTGIIEAVHKPEPPPSLPPTISWSKTREEWSGHGSDWSPWYTITSEPTPPRYALSGVAFHLTGDRQCGAWAECRQTANDGTTVTYIFRMQGHDDQTEFVDGKIQGKAAASAGILTTTYTLTSPITAPTIAPPVFPTTHTVVRGDCLARIAQHYYGIQAWEWIHEANRDHIKNPNRIYPGQLFSIPDPTHPITAPGKKRRTP
jgi:nucleoid-associated protein YgaU